MEERPILNYEMPRASWTVGDWAVVLSLVIGVAGAAMAGILVMDVLESLWLQVYFYAALFSVGFVLGVTGVILSRRWRLPSLFGVMVNLFAGFLKCSALLRIIADAHAHGFL